LGTPFRLQGRTADTGLDCVGLIALVFEKAADVPCDYALRNTQLARWTALLDVHFERRGTTPEAADIVLMQAGPAQFHLGLWTGQSLIHADAAQRRTVERAMPLPWPALGAWFTKEDS
jgi:murein DD-endopeptidase / murein LD-carboxypeptidase